MQSEKEKLERRQYVRIPRQHILRCAAFCMQDFYVRDKPLDVSGVMKDVSGNGLLFESARRFEVGTLLQMSLTLPGWDRFKSEFFKSEHRSDSRPLTVLARVVRLEAVDPQELYDIGVSFSAIDRGDQTALLRYIEQQS